MKDINEQDAEVRQFLLGQLAEEKAGLLEERIFAEPDFAEEVRIIESDLIRDYQMGELSPVERSLFEQKYLTTLAGHRAVEFENVFNEFIREKSGANLQARVTADPSSPVSKDMHEAEAHTTPKLQEQPQRRGLLSRLRALFTAHPAWAYSVLAASLLLLTIGAALIEQRLRTPVNDNPAQAERRAIEDELARLNRDVASAPPAPEGSTIDLIPTQRYGGAMPRLVISDANREGLIKLRLNLMRSGAARYRTVFLDDRRRELFAVSDLAAQNTPDGPQVWLLLPAKYLKPGDYLINLSSLGKDGTYIEDNAYSFRVIAGR